MEIPVGNGGDPDAGPLAADQGGGIGAEWVEAGLRGPFKPVEEGVLAPGGVVVRRLRHLFRNLVFEALRHCWLGGEQECEEKDRAHARLIHSAVEVGCRERLRPRLIVTGRTEERVNGGCGRGYAQ